MGDLLQPEYGGGLFEFRVKTQCTRLQLDPATGQVACAEIKDLSKGRTYTIKAKKYVICAGAILTPGILVNSGLNTQLPALVSTTPLLANR